MKAFLNWLRGEILIILSLFNKKKRNRAILSDIVNPTIEPATIKIENLTPRRTAGTVRDITMMLDRECTELYNRHPFIK